MTPRRLVEWGIAITAILVFALSVLALGADFYWGAFPRLQSLLGLSGPIVPVALLAFVASGIATGVVFLFRATRGTLEFSALGVKFTGPSGPILLWVVSFLSVVAALGVFLRALPEPAVDSLRLTLKPGSSNGRLLFFNEPNCKGRSLDAPVEANSTLTSRQLADANDMFVSLGLASVRPGFVIRLFDSPDKEWNDDWLEVTVRKMTEFHCIPDFEREMNDEFVVVVYHGRNGLNGVVSALEILNR